jgi:hypothetical protein
MELVPSLLRLPLAATRAAHKRLIGRDMAGEPIYACQRTSALVPRSKTKGGSARDCGLGFRGIVRGNTLVGTMGRSAAQVSK